MSGSDSQWIPALLSSSVYKTFFSHFHVLSLRKVYGEFDDPVSKGKRIQSLFLTCSPLRKSPQGRSPQKLQTDGLETKSPRDLSCLPAPASFSACLVTVRSPGQGGFLAMASLPLGRVGRSWSCEGPVAFKHAILHPQWMIEGKQNCLLLYSRLVQHQRRSPVAVWGQRKQSVFWALDSTQDANTVIAQTLPKRQPSWGLCFVR